MEKQFDVSGARLFLVAVFGSISAWLGILAIPMYLLLIASIIDFCTGIKASKYRNEAVTSEKSGKGIIKKLCIWLLPAISAMVDILIASTAGHLGFELPMQFWLASITASWLFINEIISILENIVDIGVDIPPFLMKIASRIKGKVEESGNTAVGGDEK